MLFSLSLVALACGSRPEPQTVYDDARLKLKRGELLPALEETNRALQRYPSEKEEWHCRFQVLKAEILVRQDLNTESLALVNAELPPSLATSDLAVRRRLTQALANASIQQPAEATRFLAEADALARANHPELLGEVALRKGTICFLAGDMNGAEDGYREALQSARERKDPFFETAALEGLGVVATKREHFDEAIDWNRGALQLARSVGAQHSLAQVLGNIGWSFFELGDFENALMSFRQAEEASAKSGLTGDRVYWLIAVAVANYRLLERDAARAALQRALELARNLDDKSILAECLNNLSEIEVETGDTELASKHNLESAELAQIGLDHRLALDAMVVRGRIDERRNDYSHAEKSFLQVIQDSKASAPQRWEAQARLAGVYADEGLAAKAEKEFRLSLETIETARSSVQTEEFRLSFLSAAISFYSDYIEFLISQHRAADAVQVAELSRARTLAEGLSSDAKASPRTMPSVPPQQLAQRLHATLLFYWLGEEHSSLWVITPTKTTYFALPPAWEIDRLVQPYRRAIIDSKDVLTTDDRLTGEKLYATLIAPAQKLIAANSRVILLPDESLYGLNFETLIAPEPKPHYWIEDVTLTTASSLTMLAAAANRPPAKGKNLLLVGNTKEANSAFPPLSQSAVEMKKIEQYFPEPERAVLEGARATPSAYLGSNPERFSYVHFVTHGTASRARPLESAVILSPEGDSYKLYARDIVTRHLRAELVTISACYGSGSRAYSGEGLVGLSWAFLRAGAHNVIGALWEVADAPATPELMDGLYREIRNGKDPATALRGAKLSLLHSANPNSVFRKPFYWAPFQLYAGS